MNPGYLGRAELPEGLKALFRPITVVVPDLELICENMLMAEGFIEAKKLATKFTTLYSLCRDLLSKAMHYDWGLRAIKSVLVVAGKFKRAEPELPEMDLLMRALRDFNLPKIVADDLRIFMGLLGDLFPQVDPPRKRDMKFEDVIEQVTAESELHNDPEFIKKVVQLKELLEIRWCVFVMGDAAGCGKSATWKTLARAQTKNGDKTTVEDLDPKVQKTDQLYGIVHPTTREWQDGIMSCKMRDLSNRPDTLPKWIILDGDLDANWIESMNSVMDDNRILTLASNERIKLLPHMRLIFEIRNLKFATPATVSRAGILYISSTTGYQWKCYLTSWIKKMKYSEDRKTELTNLFEKYIPKSLDHIRKSFKYLIPNVDISSVIAICKLLEAMYQKFDQQVKNNEMLFVFCAVWCLGAGFGEKDGIQYRKNFSTWWKDTYKTIKFGNGSVFEYYIDMDNMVMREWKNIESGDITSKLDTSKRISSFTIPTADTIANSYLMKLFL
jgi:dynein heavy chain